MTEEYKTLIRLRLRETGYPETPGLTDTVNRLATLDGEPKKMLDSWLRNNEEVIFSPIKGIDAAFLREKLGMKEPAIIISFAMLQNSPTSNSEYFKKLATQRNSFKPNNSL